MIYLFLFPIINRNKPSKLFFFDSADVAQIDGKKMGKRVKKGPAPENGETKAKLSSKYERAKSRNTANERPMAADDTEVDGKKSKVRKVKTRTATRTRKAASDDGRCAIGYAVTAHIDDVADGPANVGCDDTGHGIEAAGSADAEVEVKNVTNPAEFELRPVNPDCISPATKLAKQFKCFKEKQLSSLASGGDASVAGSTPAIARKRRGNAVQKKRLKAAMPRASSLNTGCSSPSDVTNNTIKSCQMKTGGKKGKNEDVSTNTCPDSKIARKGRTDTRGDRTVVTRKRPAKRKVDAVVVRTDAAKTTKRSCVDNKKKKSLRKPRLGKRPADVVCGPSDVTSDVTGADAGPTGEASFSVPPSAAGPSGEGAGSSDSESDWEEVDGNIWLLLKREIM